jgi:hypothetical protein
MRVDLLVDNLPPGQEKQFLAQKVEELKSQLASLPVHDIRHLQSKLDEAKRSMAVRTRTAMQLNEMQAELAHLILRDTTDAELLRAAAHREARIRAEITEERALAARLVLEELEQAK